jgi:8-oxo-dGTP diphosphatase
MEKHPRVGVGVIVVKGNKVLLGKRKNAHGGGTWSFGGGHLEFNESLEECAKREILEETGLQVKNIRLGTITNDVFRKEEKHYVTIFMIAEHASGEPQNKEPDRLEKWEWFEWNNLPRPLFLPIENLLKTSFNPFEN